MGRAPALAWGCRPRSRRVLPCPGLAARCCNRARLSLSLPRRKRSRRQEVQGSGRYHGVRCRWGWPQDGGAMRGQLRPWHSRKRQWCARGPGWDTSLIDATLPAGWSGAAVPRRRPRAAARGAARGAARRAARSQPSEPAAPGARGSGPGHRLPPQGADPRRGLHSGRGAGAVAKGPGGAPAPHRPALGWQGAPPGGAGVVPGCTPVKVASPTRPAASGVTVPGVGLCRGPRRAPCPRDGAPLAACGSTPGCGRGQRRGAGG